MFSARRKFWNRKNSDPKLPKRTSDPEERPLKVGAMPLTGATKCVSRVIFLAERNLVVAASSDGHVRVYGIDTSGEPCAVFERHDSSVSDVVQLESELVASVGYDNHLFTWRATTAEMVGEWKHDSSLLAVAILGDTKIIVGDDDGNVIVLIHQSASSFQIHRRLPNSHSKLISEITVHDDLFVTCSHDNTAKVWDTNSFKLRANLPHGTLPHDNWVRSAAVSDRNIVTTCTDKKLRVFQNGHDFNLLFDLELGILWEVAFLNDDIVAVAAENYLCFISLPAESMLPLVQIVGSDSVSSFAVLSDGRIAVGGGFLRGWYCAILWSPKSMRGHFEDYVASIVAAREPPLRTTWRDVQNRQLALAEACRTAITSENCSASLEEWCIAHDLLIEAVKRGEIPASRDLGDSIAHWHEVLYQHCAKLAMGDKCKSFVKARFREAEDAGVIAKGQIESLINTIAIRQDMDADNRFLVHAAYQLFMRHAEMDVRLREVLHYQRVQQVAAVINALIGCIPVGGAIVTNVVSGGASILNDLQVCGLVESVLGIGKDVSGGFGSDSLVDRVLRKSNVVLSVEDWDNIPAEKRKVVEDAALNLGLSIEELREKLEIVAAMQEGEGGKPSEQVVIEEVDEDTKIQPVIPIADVSEGIASLSMEVAGIDVAGPFTDVSATMGPGNVDEDEMKHLEEKGVSKDVVGPMKRGELAACFAAFLIGYEADDVARFHVLKETIEETLKKKWIRGLSIVGANEEEKEELVEVLMIAVANATDEDVLKLTRILVKEFIELSSQ